MMINLDKVSFSTKIGLGTSMIVLIASVLLTFTFSVLATRVLVDENKTHGRVQAENLALRAVDPILSADYLQLKDMVDAIKGVSDNLVYAFVLDDNGNVLAHTFSNGFPIELLGVNLLGPKDKQRIQLINDGAMLIYDFAVPVSVSGNRIGTVRLGLSRTMVQTTINTLLHPVMGVTLGTLLFSVFMGTMFANRITRRINDLRSHAEEFVTGDLRKQAAPSPALNCWEAKNCKLEKCAAHGETARPCWHLAGDRNSNRMGTPAENCSKCIVYRTNSGDEIQDLAETFDYLALTLRMHLDELYEAENAMARQQQLLRTVLDSSPDHVVLLDRDGRIKALNQAYADSLEVDAEDAVGHDEASLLPVDDPLKDRTLLAKVFYEGRVHHHEVRVERGDRKVWLHVIWVPVRNDAGEVGSVVRTARDITEIKDYQAQLIQAQKMESLGTLAGGVAHEINTPLGIILGYSQLLQDDFPADSNVHQDLQTIEKQAQVCRKIVADLLGFSRQGESEMQGMCFNNSILEVVTLIRHSFELDNVQITTDLDARMPIINGSPEQLKQVWINLFNNARDAMPDGGAIQVTSRLKNDRSAMRFTIADTGEGISQAGMDQIFDPFYSTKGVDKGTGLGLSISFGIVETHGGSITAESPVPPHDYPALKECNGNLVCGPGSIFIIEIPIDHTET